MRLCAWLSPACFHSNGTNYPATWVKQGNIHFRKKGRSIERRKHLDRTGCCLPSLEAIRTNSVPGVSERASLTLTFHSVVEPCTSSHHLEQLRFPPLFSVTGQILGVGKGRKTLDTTERGSFFCESQREQVVPSDLNSSDYRCKPSARLSPVAEAAGLECHICSKVEGNRSSPQLESSPQAPAKVPC